MRRGSAPGHVADAAHVPVVPLERGDRWPVEARRVAVELIDLLCALEVLKTTALPLRPRN